MRSIVAQHDKKMLNRLSSADTETPSCNCRKQHDCPLEEKCRTKCTFYKASICTWNGNTMSYYGCCETDFKARYYNHKQNPVKLRPRGTRLSFQSLFGDLRIRVTLRSLNGPSFAKPNHTAAAQCTANRAYFSFHDF